MEPMYAKLDHVRQIVRSLARVAVAYSGGVDSALLLKVAATELGSNAIALTAVSPSLPAAEKEAAERIAREIGAQQAFIFSREMEDSRYLANNPDRCFFCKNEVYSELIAYAQAHGYRALLDGANADDSGDHRPGQRAAAKHGVRSPLLEAGLTKSEIRSLARELGLSNWNKPAAACLSSRIPYGEAITLEALTQVERAEAALHSLGFGQLRVRRHGQIARIEVETAAIPEVIRQRETITETLQSLGFTYVALDLQGFRSGSLNESWQKAGVKTP